MIWTQTADRTRELLKALEEAHENYRVINHEINRFFSRKRKEFMKKRVEEIQMASERKDPSIPCTGRKQSVNLIKDGNGNLLVDLDKKNSIQYQNDKNILQMICLKLSRNFVFCPEKDILNLLGENP